jgi:transposase
MGGRSRLVVTAGQRAALEALSRSGRRDEADRARAILWTLEGRDGPTIGAALGVRADRVRKWRARLRAGGVEALRARPHTGRPGHRGRAALASAAAILAEPGPRLWTLPRLAAAIAERASVTVSPSYLSRLLRQKGASPGADHATASRAARIPRRWSAPACA